MSEPRTTTAGQKILEGLREAYITAAVAHCIQSWHCSQTSIPAPCGPDCSCWQSAQPIINAYNTALKEAV